MPPDVSRPPRGLAGQLAPLALVVSMGALQDASQRPVFRTEANYVEVTAIVTDKRGAFVPGLKLDDFELLEDGRLQRLADLTIVDLTGGRAEVPTFGGRGEPRRPPDSATNSAEGRTYVIALDHFHLAANQMPRVRAAVSQFIEQHLRPNDLASVVHLSSSPRASVFTSSRNALLRLAGAAPGLGAPDSQSDETLISQVEDDDIIAGMKALGAGYAAAATERSFTALGRVIEYFGTLRVRRKTLLLFSQGSEIDLLGAAAGGSPAARDLSDRAGEAIRQLIEQARRADVNIYPIDARGLAAVDPAEGVLSARTHAWGSLRILASETGGEAVLGYNRFATPFERIVNDSGRYYVLGYYTAVPNTDKKFHKLTVRVKGRPLTVRARPGFYGDTTTGSRTLAADLRREGVEGLLLRPVPVAGNLGLVASASAVSRATPGTAVQLTVELRGQDLVLGPDQKSLSGNEVDVGFLGLDAMGKASARGARHVVFQMAEENWKAIGLHGWRYVTTVELAPGYHQLRVAASEAGGGRSGSVFLELEVPDLAKGTLAMGTVLLGTTSGALTPTTGDVAVPRTAFSGPPVAGREFKSSDVLIAYVALYRNATDVAASFVVTSTVRAADGRSVWRSDAKYSGAAAGSAALDHVVAIPLVSLSPGPYLLTVETARAASNQPIASRHVTFSVR